MKKQKTSKALTIYILLISLLATFALASCDSWMKSDEFFGLVDEEVKVANAQKIGVFVRYANTKEGSTNFDGVTTQKVEVPFELQATTSDAYGFYKWAAFSTAKYATTSQHSILFNNEADYLENYKVDEISDDIVQFADPYSSTTQVVINSARSDIFIIPVVAERPKLTTSLPASGASDIVRNMTIRLVFSKEMDESTLITTNADGTKELSENIEIYRTYGTFDNMTLASIKSDFKNISLGKTKKTLSIQLPQGEKMPANTSIRVVIDGKVTDAYGYEMGNSDYISFTTGGGIDGDAPAITEMKAGRDASLAWSHNQIVDGGKEGYLARGSNISAYSATDEILKHRTTGKVYIDCTATDIKNGIASGADDVYMLYVRHIHLLNADGTAGANELSDEETYTFSSGENATDLTKTTTGYLFEYDLSALPDGMYRIDVAAVDTIGNSGFDANCYSSTNANYYRSIYVVKDTQAPVLDKDKIKQGTTNANAAPYDWYNKETLKTVTYSLEAANLFADQGHEYLRSNPKDIQWYYQLTNVENWQTPDASKWENTYDKTANKPNIYYASKATANADGEVAVTVAIRDDIGNTSEPLEINPIYYDNTPPVLDKISWTATNGTPGIATGNILTDQTLNIDFTEATAGLKKVKLEITLDDGTGTEEEIEVAPFSATGSTGFTAKYNGSAIAYTIDENDSSTLILTTPQTTGTLSLTGLKINGTAAEGRYTIKATITDTAINSHETNSVGEIGISIDTTKPIVEAIEIPNLKKATRFGSTSSEYWLDSSMVGGNHGSNYAPTQVTVNIEINEANSGVSRIDFGGTMALQNSTTLYLVETADDGTESETAITSKFNIDTSSNYIKVKDAADSLKNAEGKTSFTLRLKNVKFNNYSGRTPDTNTIKVTATDVALNKSDETDKSKNFTVNKGTDTTPATLIANFHSDSWSPSLKGTKIYRPNQKVGAIDLNDTRATHTNNTKNILVVQIGKEGSDASGHNAIEITSGGKFTDDTKIYYVTDTSYNKDSQDVTLGADDSLPSGATEITSDKFEISTDKKKVTFKDADTNYVFRAATAIAFTNVEFDTTSQGTKTIQVCAYDLTGWVDGTSTSTKTTDKQKTYYSITYDTVKPYWNGASSSNATSGYGPFVAASSSDYSTSNATSIYVYPHSSSSTEETSSTYGIIFDTTEKNPDNTQIRYFYTNAKNSSSKYGITLGIRALDNLALFGGTGSSDKITYCVYKHIGSETAGTVNSEYVITNGAIPTTATSRSGSITNLCIKAWFEADATYSVVLTDAAGNISPAYTFTLVKDNAVVDKTTSGSTPSDTGDTSFESLFEYSVGEDGYQIVSYDTTSYQQNLYPATSNSNDTSKRSKITLNFNNGTTHSYSEAKTTKTQSGLYAYRFYVSTSASLSDPSPVTSTSAYDTSYATSTSGSWHSFSSGSKSIVLYPPSDYTNSYYYHLQLQDNVGNVKTLQIRQTTTKDEKWQKDKDTIDEFYKNSFQKSDTEDYGLRLNNTCTGIHSFTGDQEDPHRNGLLGAMIPTSARTFYNDKASLRVFIDQFTAIKSNSKILSGSKKGTEPAYTYRAALVSSTSSTLPTKAQVDAKLRDTRWTLDDDTSYGWSYLTGNDSAPGDVGKYTVGTSIGEPVRDGNNRWQLKVKYPRDEEGETSQDKYMFLVIEDYTGQFGAYQIGNYSEMNNQQMKWRYDNTPPKIYLKGTTTEPKELKTVAELNALVSQPGKRVFASGTNAYVSNLTDTTTTYDSAKNRYNAISVGTNSFRSISYGTASADHIGSLHSAYYRPYFNIDVTEDIGKIKAFCYTYGTDVYPDTGSTTDYYNVTASDNKWYDGSYVTSYGVSAMIDTIKLMYGKSGESTQTIAPREIYLHVMDTVGNITTMKMGDVNWNVVAQYPIGSGTGSSGSYALPTGVENRVLVQGEFFLRQESDNQETQILNVAGTGDTYKTGADLKLTIPTNWYKTYIQPNGTDAGIYGYSFTKGDVSKVVSTDVDEDGKPFLRIPYSKYSTWTSETKLEYYVYDKCGNFFTVSNCKGVVDATCPKLYMQFNGDSDSPVGKIYDKQTNTIIDSDSSSTIVANGNESYTTTGMERVFTKENTGAGSSKTNPYKIYSNARTSSSATTGSIKGTFRAKDQNGSSHGEIEQLIIKRYKITDGVITDELVDADKEDGYYKSLTKAQIEAMSSEGVCSITNLPISLDDGGNSGKLYEISISDLASNTNTVYLAVYKDRDAPEFTPVAEPTKGLIGVYEDKPFIGSSTYYYYYNTMDIQFTPDDGNGIGADKYNLVIGSSAKTAQTITTDTCTISTADYATSLGTKDTLKVTVTDKLGNEATKYIKYGSTEVKGSGNNRYWARDTVAPSITAFTKMSSYGEGSLKTDSSTLYYVESEGKDNNFQTYKNYDFTIEFNAEDTGKINGYFVSKKSTNPEVPSTLEKDKKIKIKPSTYITNTTSGSGSVYFYAVDYAGNISAGKELSIAKYSGKPEFIGSCTIVKGTTYSRDHTNYYSSDTEIKFKIRDPEKKIIDYGLVAWVGSKENNAYNAYAWYHNTVNLASGGDGYEITLKFSDAPVDTFKKATSATYGDGILGIDAFAKNEDKGIVYQFIPHPTGGAYYDKWVEDATAPTVTEDFGISDATLPADSGKLILSGSKLTYNTAAAGKTVTLTFNEEPTDDGSGFKGYSIGETGTVSTNGTLTLTLPDSTTDTSEQTYDIYAWDNVNNKQKVGEVKTQLDNSVSNITGVDEITPDNGEGAYFDGDNNTLYYKADSIGVKVSVSDSDVDHYFYGTDAEGKTSTDGTFTIPPADGTELKFYAVDKLGNVSTTPYTITLVQDTTVAKPEVSGISAIEKETNTIYPTDSCDYVVLKDGIYYYNSNKISSFKLAMNEITGEGSGFDKFTCTGATAAFDADTNTITLTSPNGEVAIKAVDKVGNESTEAAKITFKKISKITIDGDKYNFVNFNGKIAHDNNKGPNYGSNLYKSDTKVNITIKDAPLGYYYGYAVANDSDTAPTTGIVWSTELSTTVDGSAQLQIPLPSVTDLHQMIFIYAKDPVGNEATPIELANTPNGMYKWWILYTPISSATYKYTANASDATKGTITVTLPQRVAINEYTLSTDCEEDSSVKVKVTLAGEETEKANAPFLADSFVITVKNVQNGKTPSISSITDAYGKTISLGDGGITLSANVGAGTRLVNGITGFFVTEKTVSKRKVISKDGSLEAQSKSQTAGKEKKKTARPAKDYAAAMEKALAPSAATASDIRKALKDASEEFNRPQVVKATVKEVRKEKVDAIKESATLSTNVGDSADIGEIEEISKNFNKTAEITQYMYYNEIEYEINYKRLIIAISALLLIIASAVIFFVKRIDRR